MEHLWAPWRLEYIKSDKKKGGCILCNVQKDEKQSLVIYQGSLSFVVLNKYPYSTGHLMVCPNRHVDSLDKLTKKEISEMGLLKQKCKIILIACNSASTAAFELVKEYVGPKAKVLDVIDPVVEYIGQNYENAKIGLIGTKQTVFSNVYKKKIDELDRGIVLQSLATPLLVPMIEEDFCHNKIIDSLIHSYLQDPVLSDIEALVLACTHYPLIKDQLMLFYKDKVKIIDSSGLTAQALKKILECENIKNMKKTTGKMHFYVSDYTDSFSRSAAIFFQNKLVLEHYPL